MAAAAETQTALNGLTIQQAPLGEDVLRSIRAVLIKRSHAVTLQQQKEDLFTTLLQTAQTPTLTQSHRALACDSLSTYLIRSRHHPLPLPCAPPPWPALVAIITTHFDDAQSALSKALKDLLGNVLSAHTDPAPFAQSLAETLLAAVHRGAGKKVGYYILETLLRKRVVTAAALLAAFPGGDDDDDLVAALLAGMGDRTLAPVVGKALVTLLGARRAEMQVEEKEVQVQVQVQVQVEGAWVAGWSAQVRGALRCEGLRGNVQTYVLPGLFRVSQAGFRAFVDGLGLSRYSGGAQEEEGVVIMRVEGEDPDGEELMSLLCSLKVGKDLGYVSEEAEKEEEEEGEMEGQKGAKVVGSKKSSAATTTTTTVPSSFITPLLFHSHPHIRLAALTLLTHSPAPTHPLPASSLSALKTALPHLHTETDAEVRNLTVQSLRHLLERLAASSYHLSKTHQTLLHHHHHHHRNTTKALSRLTAQIGAIRDFIIWYVRALQTQLHPGSSYQRTTTALKMLAVLARSGVDTALLRVPRDPKRIMNWPADWAGAVRVLGPGIERALTDALFNPFDDVRAMAAELLALGPPAADAGLLAAGVQRMDASGRERDADGVARVVVLRWGAAAAAGGDVVVEVLGMLEAYLAVARSDFQQAVRGRPVHGLLAGLRMVLEKEGAWAGVGRDVVVRVLRACEEIWEITRAVLCVDSPEGCMPDVGEDEEDEEVNSQTVMSYSWRAVKESSSLLATVLSHAPYDPTSPTTSPLHATDFSTAGTLLLSQLTHIRHRGAFSAVSPSFTTLCHTCFTSADTTLHALPPQWLTSNLHLITTTSSKITRRSAGLPYLLLGVLTTEPDPSRPLLKSTFAHLCAVAAQPASNTADKIDLPQVHALNCMKHLFTDSRMAAAAAPYVGSGLALAVGCFGAGVWALRNCGIMLFTALLGRLVGVRRVDAREFFGRYPGVREVLARGLRERVAALDVGGAVEMVYPALSLIARLECADGGAGMEEFVECVLGAMGCRVWKVREMAARAYAGLVGGGEEWASVVVRLLREAGGEGVVVVGTNGVHGRLCAVRVLLERRRGGELAAVWRAMGEAFDALVVRSRCAVIKAVCLQIITDHGLSTGALTASDALHEKVSSYVTTAAEALAEIENAGIVGRTLFKTHLTALMVTRALHSPTPARIEGLITLLASADDDEEASLSVTELLLESPHQLQLTPREASSLDRALWALVSSHPWDQLRTAALKLLHRYGGGGSGSLESNWRTALDLCTAPPTEPCKDAALATLGHLTARVWEHYQTLPSGGGGGGAEWAEWCLDQLMALVTAAAHEDQPYPAREAALHALAALAPVLRFEDLRCHRWRSQPETLRAAYLALYDLLNDDDEDLRDGAADAVCRLLVLPPGTAYTPLRAGDALLEAVVAALGGGGAAPFFRDVAGRLRGVEVGVEVQLERLVGGGGGGGGLFARERQNLFVDEVVEAQRWGRVLAVLGDGEEELRRERAGFACWVGEGLVAFDGAVRAKGREGPLGWLGDEEVFVLAVRVVEGVGAVRRWAEKGWVDDGVWERVERCSRALLQALRSVQGHEGIIEALEGALGC